jgi:hypothetical protein
MEKEPKRTHRKPTGKLGSLVIGVGRTAAFQAVRFPESKRPIERQIFEAARRASESVSPSFREFYGLTAEPLQNSDEQGPDYILQTKSGEQYLDLAEAAPLAKLGGTYDDLGLSYINGERADLVYDEVIAGKVARYGKNRRDAIHLLLYATDFRLSLSSEVLDLLGYRASRQPHGFPSIVYFDLDGTGKGEFHVIYPRPLSDFEVFDEASVRPTQTVFADFPNFRPIPDGAATQLGFSRPPGEGPIIITIDAELEPD